MSSSESTILGRAPTRAVVRREALLRSAIRRERGSQCNRRRKGVWRFEGLTSLLPVYEQLEESVLGRQEAETQARRTGD